MEMDNTEKSVHSWHFLNNFHIKLIAILTMTFDHIGVFLSLYFLGLNHPVYIAFRVIGRLSLPLFAFMTFEGVMHTKHFGKYILRLGFLATVVSIALAVMVYGFSYQRDFGNIFIDLILGAVGVYCLKDKRIGIKVLAILPLIFVGLSTYTAYEESYGLMIHWFPFFLRCQYHYFGVGLIYGYYGCYILKEMFLDDYSQRSGLDKELLVGTTTEQSIFNIIAAFWTIGFAILFAFFNFGLIILGSIQFYAVISGALLLFYNGKRGYNSKWFQYGMYAYYPLHIAILYLIFELLV